MKKTIVTLVIIMLFSCSNQEDVVTPILLKEIKAYIDISESKAKARDTYYEHSIFLVIFSNKDSIEKIDIIENNFYFKKNMDGYIKIGDNNVFFYHSNIDFVDKNLLIRKHLESIPDENSDEASEALDAEAWRFLIKNKEKLERINYVPEGFGIVDNRKNESIKDATIIQTDLSKIKYQVKFPDTVYLNKQYHGELNYESILDTIITEFGDKNKNRYTRLMINTSDRIIDNYKDLKLSVVDTFGAIDNRTIPFYNLKFDKKGVNYIQGFINDIVVISLSEKDEDGNDLSRLIEQNVPIYQKVVVIENIH